MGMELNGCTPGARAGGVPRTGARLAVRTWLLCFSLHLLQNPCAAFHTPAVPCRQPHASVPLSAGPRARHLRGMLCPGGSVDSLHSHLRPAAPVISPGGLAHCLSLRSVTRSGRGKKRIHTALQTTSEEERGQTGLTWLQKLRDDPVFMQALAWGSFAFLLYIVKPFYGVIAGTFIMAFVGNGQAASLFALTHARRRALMRCVHA
jgi:hypothetical protein